MIEGRLGMRYSRVLWKGVLDEREGCMSGLGMYWLTGIGSIDRCGIYLCIYPFIYYGVGVNGCV